MVDRNLDTAECNYVFQQHDLCMVLQRGVHLEISCQDPAEKELGGGGGCVLFCFLNSN